MSKLFSKYFILLFLQASLLLPLTIKPVSKEEMMQLQQIMQQNPSFILIGEMFELIAKVEQAIHFIAIQIKQNNVKGVKNHLRASKILLELKNITQSMLTDKILLQVDPIQQTEIVTSYAHIMSDLIDHIDWLISKKFIFANKADAARARFDIVKSMQRGAQAQLSSLPQILQALSDKVALFEKNAHEITLTGLNKFSRKLNQKIVDPWNRWNMTEVTKYGLAGGLTATFILWKFAGAYQFNRMRRFYKNSEVPGAYNRQQNGIEEFDYKKWNAVIKKEKHTPNVIEKIAETMCKDWKFGYPSGCFEDQGGEKWTNLPSDWKAFNSIDYAASQLFGQQWPLATLLGGYFIGKTSEKWSGLWYPWLARHMEHIWNQMLGGAHKDVNVGHTFNVIPDVTLDDVIGMDEVKELFQHIIEFVINPEPFYTTNTAPHIRIILSGKTRSGKTYMVEALAGSLSQAFAKAGKNPDELKYWPIPGIAVQKFGIQHILEEAKKHAPIVLFIDEIDLLNLQRGANTDLLGDFLTGMGNNLSQDPAKPVVLIVATNRPETLDPALLTPGRFGKEIRFELPPFRFRKEFLIREFEKLALDVTLFDIDSLASKTDGLSFEQLRAVLRGGMIRAWSRKVPLTQAILEESLDSEIRGIITVNRKELPEYEKHILGSHFAGQALAYTLFDTGKRLDIVTLKAIQTELDTKRVWDTFSNKDTEGKDGKKIIFGQIFTSSIGDSADFANREQVINHIKVLVAGFMAEELLVGSCGNSCHPEFATQAYDLAQSLIIGEIEIEKLSKKRREELLDKVFDLLEQCKKEVYAELEKNRELLVLITQELKKRDGLTHLEMQQIIDEYNNPSQAVDIVAATEAVPAA